MPASGDALNYFDPPKRLIWSLLAAVLVVYAASRSSADRGGRPLRLALLAVLLWIIGRTLFRPQPDVELDVLMTWGLPAVLFWTARSLDPRHASRPIAWALALSGGVQVVLMVLQYCGWDPILAATTLAIEYRPARMIGTIGYQNQAADFVALSGVAWFILVRHDFTRLALLCLLLVPICMTGSRGAIAAASFAILVSQFFLWWPHVARKRRAVGRIALAGTLVAIAVAVLVILLPTTRQRFQDVFRNWRGVPAIASRVSMARIAGTMWAERPFTGWGAGAYAFQYLDRLGSLVPAKKTHAVLQSIVFARETHNDYLQFGAEFGLIGMTLMAALIILGTRTAWKAEASDRIRISGTAYIAAYMAISSLFSFPWQTSMAGPLAAFLLGLLLTCGYARERREPGQGFMRLQNIERLIFVTLVLILLSWNAFDAYLNVAVPARLQQGKAVETARQLPGWAYKYHAIVGAALAKEERYGEAVTSLGTAQNGYRDVLLYNNLGYVLSKQGRWPDAVCVYEQWVRCGLEHAKALGNLSIAYEQIGEFEKAAAFLERQAQLWPDNRIESVSRLAVLHLKAENPIAALRVLQRHSNQRPGHARTLPAEFDNLMGAAYLKVGDLKAAGEWFKLALKKNPSLESARKNLQGLEHQ